MQEGYYDGLPFRPGVAAHVWLAAQCRASTRVLDAHIPDTVILADGSVTWLRSTQPTSLVVQPFTEKVECVPTTETRWRRSLKRALCPDLSRPVSALSRASLMQPVAVHRVQATAQTTATSVVPQGLFDAIVKDAVPGTPATVVQAYVRCKGVKPCVYRITWKRGKPSIALVITSRALFDHDEVRAREWLWLRFAV